MHHLARSNYLIKNHDKIIEFLKMRRGKREEEEEEQEEEERGI